MSPSTVTALVLTKTQLGLVASSKSERASPQSEASQTEGSATGISRSTTAQAKVGTSAVSEVKRLQSELGARQTAAGTVVTLPADVLFDFDKWDIRPDARTALLKVKALIEAQKPETLTIEGHTDGKGSQDYNQGLSERRAQSVAAWLKSNSAFSGSVREVGYGKTRPVAPNTKPNGADDPEGRQRNRRVELILK
jgi:outer membrane protein OmpA-like peptidoglycan-associated protein